MGLGAYPASGEAWLGMLGMHGTYEANMAMNQCDVMLCLGARFDDRITGRLDAFSPDSIKVHVDIDRSSINKTVRVDLPIVADVGTAIRQMIDVWKGRKYQATAADRMVGQDQGLARGRMPELSGQQSRNHAAVSPLSGFMRQPRTRTRSSPPKSASTRCGRRSIFISKAPTNG